MMMGGQREAKIVAKAARDTGPPALELRGLCAEQGQRSSRSHWR